MGTIRTFDDLEVFQLAIEAADLIYDITSVGQFSTDYVLRDQIRKSGISIFSNIAEGFERDGNKEFINFLSISKGSCGEARAQAIFAHRRDYISDNEFDLLNNKLILTGQQLGGFSNYLRKSGIKGKKFI